MPKLGWWAIVVQSVFKQIRGQVSHPLPGKMSLQRKYPYKNTDYILPQQIRGRGECR